MIYIILVVMISISVLASNYALYEAETIRSSYDMVKTLKNEKMVLYMGRGLDESRLNVPHSVATMRYGFFTTHERVHFYSRTIVENFDIPLSKGAWETEPKKVGNTLYYPIVINRETSDYKLGKTANMQMQNGTLVNIYICGVLGKDQKYIDLSMGTNVPNANHLVKTCMRDDVFFFGINETYPQNVTRGWLMNECSSRLVFFDQSITDAEYEENYRLCQNQGWSFTYDTLMANSHENLMYGYTVYLPLVLCLILLSIVGVVCFTVLSVKNNHSYYSCFLLCGGTKRDCTHLSLFHLTWVVVISILAVLVVAQLLVNSGNLDGWYELSIVNVLASLALYGFVLAVGFVVTRLLFRNKTVTQLLKEDS